LSRLNWHPVVEYEIREIERKQRMKQLKSEIAQIEKETEQLQKENVRLAQINSRLARFEREHLSGSTPPPSTGNGCS
jgi:DNA repair exonuclease SbcCD ATPase subunit